MYTAEDVDAAWFAEAMDSDQRVQWPDLTIDEVLRQFSYESCDPSSDRAGYETSLAQNRADYARGKEVLRNARIVTTERFRAPDGEGKVAVDNLKRKHELASPVVLREFGQIAYSTAYRYVALVEK